MVDFIQGRTTGRGEAVSSGGAGELAPGRVVRATVLGPQPGGLTLLRLLGQTVLAESRVPLAPGQALTLTVVQTSPQLVLSLGEGSASPGVGRLTQALQEVFQGQARLARNLAAILELDLQAQPLRGPRAQGLALRLQELVGRVLVEGGRPEEGQGLRRVVVLTGMDLEARLARAAQGGGGPAGEAAPESLRTLVPALVRELAPELGLLARPEPARTAALKGFLAAAQDLQGHFEANQRLNAELLPREALLFMSLPLAWGGQPGSGEMLVGWEGQDERGRPRGETHLALRLELSALGPLGVEVRWLRPALRGLFTVDAPDKAAFLEGLLPALAQRLGALGFTPSLQARCRPPQELAQQSPLARLIRRQGSYLSVTV